MDTVHPLSSVVAPRLTTIVPRLLEHSVDAIDDWDLRLLSGGWEATTSVFLLSGRARIGSTAMPWRVVLKIVRPTSERLDPHHWNYWKREVLAYQSGLLTHLPGSMAAPGVYGIDEQPDQSVWLWLEAVSNMTDEAWPLSVYERVAQHLGQFNGAYLTSQRIPEGAWVSQGWLRNYVSTYAPGVEQLPAHRHHPLVECAVPSRYMADLLRLCADRTRFLDALDQLPQTFCHMDAWRWNLFYRTTGTSTSHIVAVDWAFAGIGAIGQEVAPLIFSNRSEQAMERQALRHYLTGLRAVGWEGDERLVQFGYSATMALEYGLAAIGFYVDALLDDQQHASLEQGFGKPVDQLILLYASWMDYALPRAEQARRLIDNL